MVHWKKQLKYILKKCDWLRLQRLGRVEAPGAARACPVLGTAPSIQWQGAPAVVEFQLGVHQKLMSME